MADVMDTYRQVGGKLGQLGSRKRPDHADIQEMTGGRPIGRPISNRIRLEISLACLSLVVLVPATARAALTDLFDPLSQALPVVESVSSGAAEALTVAPPTEMVVETLEPAIDPVDDTVDQVDEVVEPFVEPPPADLPEVVDPPLSGVVGGGQFTHESNSPVVESPDYGPNLDGAIDVSGGAGVAVQDNKKEGLNELERSLLSTDPTGSFAMISRESSPVDNGWLSRLTAWLPPILAGLVDVLAAPVKLLWLLLRALVSSGEWLIAPTSLLFALGFMMVVDRNAPSLSSMRRELANAATVVRAGSPVSHDL